MKTFRFFYGVSILLAGMLFTACQDDLTGPSRYNDGKLHFKFIFENKNGAWKEPATRGLRISGEAFENGVTSLGIYGKVGSQVMINGTEYAIGTSTDEFQENGDWYSQEIDLDFPGDGGWPDGDKGYFYGYAPFPGSGSNQAKCYTVDFSGAAPTMTFTMQADEADNKDILAAKKEDVSHSSVYANGIEMTFRHVLSALKFKFKNTEVKAHVDGHDYYIQLKTAKLIGVYNQGTANIGGELNASLWAPETSTGDCSINTPLTWAQLKADANKADDGKYYMNNDAHCLLVLPQTAPTGAKIAFKCDLTEDEAGTVPYLSNITIEAPLAGAQWLPGHSYTYTLGETNATTLWVRPGVLGWQTQADHQTNLNLDYGTTSLTFDMLYYRYDATDLDNWADSYVMVSTGEDTGENAGKPLRSPFMTCDIQVGTQLDAIKIESTNPNFQFVTATASGDPTHPVNYTTSAQVEVTTSGKLQYYVVPTASATAGETTEVRMYGYKSGNKVAVLPYNADVMPGSADHTTIQYKYFSATDYDNAGSNANVRIEMAE